MNSPHSDNPFEGPVSDESPLYRDNLIYLPFARHLAEVDEAEEQELKAA